MNQNNTDIILKQTSPFGDQVQKVELDAKPDRTTQFKQGLVRYIMLPSSPLQLILDGLGWTNASALLLYMSAVWTPMLIIWGSWALTLCILVWLPSRIIGTETRIAACVRLMQVSIGALALIITI